MTTIKILDEGGAEFTVAAEFGPDRVIAFYRGTYTFADRISADEFELSGIPARPGAEKDTLNALVATVETTLTVTKDPE